MNSPYPFRRSSRSSSLEISEIVAISERAAEMRRSGADIISFGTGEPDFPTPPHVVEAAHAAAKAGLTRYPATAGIPDLRSEIAASRGLGRENVIVCTGAKQVLANAMLATLDPGDEVIMAAPYWTTYSDIVTMCEAKPVIVRCAMRDGFKLSPAALDAAITPKTRWLILNSPSNPTGAVYTADELAALAGVLERHPQVWIISDEIYRHLSFVPFTSFFDAAPGLRDRMLVVDGVSKAWAMTGWRIGWGIGPRELIAALAAVQGQITSGACSIAQAAALAALQGSNELLDERRENLMHRRNRVLPLLQAIPQMDCPTPDGAFYLFPSCARLIVDCGGPFDDDAAFCSWLLETVGVALVPGRAFGTAGHVRLSFAYAERELVLGLTRIADALARLK